MLELAGSQNVLLWSLLGARKRPNMRSVWHIQVFVCFGEEVGCVVLFKNLWSLLPYVPLLAAQVGTIFAVAVLAADVLYGSLGVQHLVDSCLSRTLGTYAS